MEKLFQVRAQAPDGTTHEVLGYARATTADVLQRLLNDHPNLFYRNGLSRVIVEMPDSTNFLDASKPFIVRRQCQRCGKPTETTFCPVCGGTVQHTIIQGVPLADYQDHWDVVNSHKLTCPNCQHKYHDGEAAEVYEQKLAANQFRPTVRMECPNCNVPFVARRQSVELGRKWWSRKLEAK